MKMCFSVKEEQGKQIYWGMVGLYTNLTEGI